MVSGGFWIWIQANCERTDDAPLDKRNLHRGRECMRDGRRCDERRGGGGSVLDQDLDDLGGSDQARHAEARQDDGADEREKVEHGEG